MSGDIIANLPMNNSKNPKPGDLEIIHHIFKPQNLGVINQIVSPFKNALIGALLFGLFSLPIVLRMSDGIFKNVIYSRLVLMAFFLITLFMVSRMLK